MTYKTHVSFAIAASIPVCEYAFSLGSTSAVLFLSASAIGSLSPDFDEEGSYLSRKIPVLPMIFKIFGVKHRGATHRAIAVFALCVFFVSLALIEKDNTLILPIATGFIFGYIFHLLGDMLTKGGIRKFFYPVSEKTAVLFPRKYRFYTGSIEEMFVCGIFSSIAFFEYAMFTGAI
jgi:inner membrane protein